MFIRKGKFMIHEEKVINAINCQGNPGGDVRGGILKVKGGYPCFREGRMA